MGNEFSPSPFPAPSNCVQSLSQPTTWKKKNLPFISRMWLEPLSRWSPRSHRSGFSSQFLQCSGRSPVPKPAAKCQKEREQRRECGGALHCEPRCRILWNYLLRGVAGQFTAAVTGVGGRLLFSREVGWCTLTSAAVPLVSQLNDIGVPPLWPVAVGYGNACPGTPAPRFPQKTQGISSSGAWVMYIVSA